MLSPRRFYGGINSADGTKVSSILCLGNVAEESTVRDPRHKDKATNRLLIFKRYFPKTKKYFWCSPVLADWTRRRRAPT